MSDAVEQWVSIVDFPGYEVSDQGRVRTLDRIVPRRGMCGPLRINGRMLKPYVARFRSGKPMRLELQLNRGGKSYLRRVAVLVLEAFKSARPALDLDGCHNDGNCFNNVISNLRWDTRASNVADTMSHGTFRRGSRVRTAKLDEDIVARLRNGSLTWVEIKTIMVERDVSAGRIRDVAAGRDWPHVVTPPSPARLRAGR